MSFMQKLMNFFRGRYGNDQLNIALFCVYLPIVVINSFVGSLSLAIVETALLVYIFFRMLSKNIYKRMNENEKFMSFFSKIKKTFMRAYNAIRYHNKFLYRTCPKCHARLRMTRKRGKHTVKCPLCKNEFEVRIL